VELCEAAGVVNASAKEFNRYFGPINFHPQTSPHPTKAAYTNVHACIHPAALPLPFQLLLLAPSFLLLIFLHHTRLFTFYSFTIFLLRNCSFFFSFLYFAAHSQSWIYASFCLLLTHLLSFTRYTFPLQ
jgi:hypothetical protein